MIFPDWRNRTNFRWGNYTFQLESFKPDYSHDKHTSFIHSATNASLGNKKLIEEAYRWEEIEASKERDRQKK
jgi:hypothetical protein